MGSHLQRAILMALALVCVTSKVQADDVTVKGDTLHGTVTGLTPVVIDEDTTLPGIGFETKYGKGAVAIPFKDIEALQTEAPVHVLHGEDDETVGRLWGVSGTK